MPKSNTPTSDGAQVTNETLDYKRVGSDWHLFKLGVHSIAECWDEVVVHLKHIPTIAGTLPTPEMLNTLLQNLLREAATMWLMTDGEMKPLAGIVGAPQHMVASATGAFVIEGVWSAVEFNADVYTEVIEQISAYARARGCAYLVAHVADRTYAQRLCATKLFQQSPAVTVWRAL